MAKLYLKSTFCLSSFKGSNYTVLLDTTRYKSVKVRINSSPLILSPKNSITINSQFKYEQHPFVSPVLAVYLLVLCVQNKKQHG